ncbi:MAG TPA: iron chelate uptake ABC transporter family permease subunit [Phycisphaerales bacterium]|nr:iron chelate uptake ABC transporter family permease subunit [Phycisphaerales bacterium]
MTPAGAGQASGASLAELADILLLRSGVNAANVLLGATLLGCAAGLVGAFALLRKRSLMTDALAHATLPGICAAFLIADSVGLAAKSLPILLAGAAATGVLGVLAVQLIVGRTRVREDAAIGIVLSVFFGAGVVLLSAIPRLTPTPSGGLNSFIYGQAAALQRGEVVLIGAIGAGVLGATALLLKPLALVSFNDAFAQSLGWPVRWIDLALMALVVLVTIAGLQSVGLIMIVALLIIPPAAARFWTDRLWRMLLASAVIGGLSGYAGATLSAAAPNKPAGAVIVLTAGALFGASMLLAPRRGVAAEGLRRLALHLRVAGDHMLEALHDAAPDHPRGLPLAALARARGLSALHARPVLAVLRARALVSRSGGLFVLTARGRAEGARVSRNHRLWAEYLVTHAEVARTHVDWSADQVEHVLSEELVAALEQSIHSRGGTRLPGATP